MKRRRAPRPASASAPGAAWLDLPAVLLRFTISRATLERRLRDGSIPRPVRLGALRRWSAAEVERFEQRLLADRLAP